MSLPALRAVRERYPESRITVLARPWVADLYARVEGVDRVVPCEGRAGWQDWGARWKLVEQLRAEAFDCAILFQNAFEAALVARLAGIPRRIGYSRDGRRWLLTDPVPVPQPGEIPRHERFYYLEMLRRAGIIHGLPRVPEVRLDGAETARLAGERRTREANIEPPLMGVSPGAAYGGAKRWLPERFAEAAAALARDRGASVALFGSPRERDLCEEIARQVRGAGAPAWNLAGQTSLAEFIEWVAACRVFLSNDSGAMHIAAALGVPTIAVFGATDDTATGPAGASVRVVRHRVECSPCLLRECPIDHRCMTGVSAARVAALAGELWRAPVGQGQE